MTLKYVRAISAAITGTTASETVTVQLNQTDLDNLIGKQGSLRPAKMKLVFGGTGEAALRVKKMTFDIVTGPSMPLTVLNSVLGWDDTELNEYLNDEVGIDAPRFAVEDGYKITFIVDNSGGTGDETIAVLVKLHNAQNLLGKPNFNTGQGNGPPGGFYLNLNQGATNPGQGANSGLGKFFTGGRVPYPAGFPGSASIY